jgi:hypothetical protein
VPSVFEIEFDPRNLKLLARGPFRDGALVVERISSDFAPRQIVSAVRTLCGDAVIFKVGGSAGAWNATFRATGATFAGESELADS